MRSNAPTIWVCGLLLTLVACGEMDGSGSGDDSSAGREGDGDRTFPADGDGDQKEDAFGRSLVGAPNPYPAKTDLDAEELRTNMRRRREVAWEAARRVLEPVPLLSLRDRASELPDCAEDVEADALKRCSEQSDASSCTSLSSGGTDGICRWNDDAGTCERACDRLTMPDGESVPEIPRWQTWYGARDIERIFRRAYGQLGEEEQLDREPLSDLQIGRSFDVNNTAVDRSSRWPLWRYTNTVMELFGCELERRSGESDAEYRRRCAAARQSRFSGAAGAGNGIARVLYSPAAVLHTARNYGEVLECRDERFEGTWCGDGEDCEDPPENFSTCFRQEFPKRVGKPWAESAEAEGGLEGLPEAGGSVLVKASWRRVGFDFDLPAFDTGGDALEERIGEGAGALWGEEGNLEGDRRLGEEEAPGPDEIYTVETREGQKYRLTGLHIMTKELRHWMWISLWWSDEPDRDFGADRPESFDGLPEAWGNYKMCVVVDYRESDSKVLERFEDLPSLQNALEATDPGEGNPTWCSNPYIEHGSGNARTNCIGCHQHAGTNYRETTGNQLRKFDLEEVIADASSDLNASNRYPANGRLRRRTHFPTDYAWTFRRLDNLTEMIWREVEHRGSSDASWERRRSILESDGDPEHGGEIFQATGADRNCTDCHSSGGIGANLEERFGRRTDWQLISSILEGRGRMPAWGDRLTDDQLADVWAYLEREYGR